MERLKMKKIEKLSFLVVVIFLKKYMVKVKKIYGKSSRF